ncbi:MAG: ADP-ribosylglycohydrolase family protein [Cyanobacteria bacterium]|nr:ADP-ribosylglycohydrolase family protein [Cyanobacteriota bacterium]
MNPLKFSGTFFFPRQFQAIADQLPQPKKANDPEYQGIVYADPASGGQFFYIKESTTGVSTHMDPIGGFPAVIDTADFFKKAGIPFKYTDEMQQPSVYAKPDEVGSLDDVRIAGLIHRRKTFEYIPPSWRDPNPFLAPPPSVSPVQAISNQPLTILQRIQGAMFGIASGDSLGCVVEFNTPQQIQARFGVHKDITGGSTGPSHPHEYPKGAVTDDTQMTVLVAQSLLAYPEGNMSDMLGRFLLWISANPPGTGKGTRQVLKRAASLDLTKQTPDTAAREIYEADNTQGGGNGSIMRCAPIALMYANQPDRMRQLSIDSTKLTHYSPESIASTLAYNRVLAAIVNGTAKNRDEFLSVIQAAAKEVASISPKTADVLNQVPTISDKAKLPTSGYTLDTLRVAMWALLNCQTLEEAIITVVNLGGDTDSNGAVTGALFGALQGPLAVPDRWKDALLNRDELLTLSEKMAAPIKS